MAAGQVLIVSADERWLRVLEVTVRLGGGEAISRHSVGEGLRIPAVDSEHPTAIVMDLGAHASPAELAEVGGLVEANTLPVVLILPEQLAAERERLVAVGATVLVRPYRPSELYAALWPGEPVGTAEADGDEPLEADDVTETDGPGGSSDG